MSNLQVFQVLPNIPEPLSFLEVLSRNLWWCWQRDAIDLFRRIDPPLWMEAERNPVVFLTRISQERYEELTEDEGFLAHLARVKTRFEELAPEAAGGSNGGDRTIAYFSMEFGIHESLPLFAGGLGILAGDHLKAASDMSLPLVGVGLFYRKGYFHQFLTQDGWQQEEYQEKDTSQLPLERALDSAGNEVFVTVTGPTGDIKASVWKVQVGRVPLYLLDTNLLENPPDIRDITSRLYGGDHCNRLNQEILLGIGGMRALEALGIVPSVCHMNEGHCAFLTIERLAQIIARYGVDLKTALEIVPRTSVFTTHTPVRAGYDKFSIDVVRPCLVPFEERLGTHADEMLSWGKVEEPDDGEPFSMFALGLRMSQYCNGVSRLHGSVARRTWSHLWPQRPEDEVPITHVTNGVHVLSWLSHENILLFEKALGPDWHEQVPNPDIIKRVDEIYDEELIRAHEKGSDRLIRYCRRRMADQYQRRNASAATMKGVESVLDQDILTIVFARRFATYKRADLLLHDPERFEAIINSEKYPVQFIFAGKAHPRDNEGKEVVKRLTQFVQKPHVNHRVIFIEDYDINTARYLLQGADVWLNTPRRPLEACGTSGMKAAINGVLNVSVLDGWWCEGYSEETGWRIGNGEEYADPVYQDTVESQALYNVLENDVIPCFYERDHKGVSKRWVQMMKESIKMAMQSFCTQRMVGEYEERFYVPAAARFDSLTEQGAQEAKGLVAQRERIQRLWNAIRVQSPVREGSGPVHVGQTFAVTAEVTLGELSPDEVEVQLYYGHLKSVEILTASLTEEMTVLKELGDGRYLYGCNITCRDSGQYGFTARARPKGDDLIKFAPGLIAWA